MFHYIYKITNILNNKFYIGCRSCKVNPENDDYTGSGLWIKRSKRKYKEKFKEIFIKEIWFLCKDREAKFYLESIIIDEELLKNPLCMNLYFGGVGGSPKMDGVVTEKGINKMKTLKLSEFFLDKILDKIKIKEDGTLVIYLKNPVEIVCGGDLLFTVKGELGILAEKEICVDGREVHLNSRNCKQIREMEQTLLDVLLDKIGMLEAVDSNKVEQAKNEFKEMIKREIKEEIIAELGENND